MERGQKGLGFVKRLTNQGTVKGIAKDHIGCAITSLWSGNV